MLIEITYNVTDVFMSTTETPVYVEISFEQPGNASAVWGSITGTLSNQTDLQNALNLKVPYTGATTNVNLGEYELKAGQVTLDTSPTGTAAVGTIRWNDTTGTSETTLKGGNVILKNGVDLVARVVNKVTPNTTLTKAAYQAVRVSGAQGQRLAVAFAQANNDANSADTIGIVIETIPTNQEGFIMTVGQLEGINTTGSLQGETWADGDVLYLSPTTAGALTNIKPTAVTGHIVVVGYVEYAHANNGKIYVKVMNGWELDELHNVSIVTPTNNQGLFYNSSNSLWENKTISTALGYTPVPTTRNITINGVTYDLSADRTYTISTGISGSGASGQVTYWTGASAVSGSNNLFWDNANGRLGIGTNAPATALHVNGDLTIRGSGSTSASSGVTLLKSNGASTFAIRNDGLGIIYGNFQINSSLPYLQIVPTSWGSFYLQSGVNIAANAAGDYTNFQNPSAKGFVFTHGGTASLLISAATSNISIGSTSDNGQRLQVYGDTLLRGSGNTSATTALSVQNSDSTNLLRVRNDGALLFSNGSDLQIYSQQNSARSSGIGSGFAFQSSLGSGIVGPDFRFFNGFVGSAITSGTRQGVLVNNIGFLPTSGTATYTILQLESLINQTGGANGITRGLYVNPTLTAAADFRAIETSAGNVLFGSNFFWNNTNGRLGIGIATPAVSLDVRTSVVGELAYFANTAANSGLIIGTQTNVGYISSVSSLSALGFGINGATSGIRIFTNSNVAINSAADLGVRFGVVGDTLLRGSGATSATTALTVQNSDSTNLFRVRNEGRVFLGSSSTSIYPMDKATTSISLSGNGLSFFDTSTGSGDTFYYTGSDYVHTSGVARLFNATRLFWPTSGTGSLVMFNISPNINQTGGANGITRGLYVNPTLTSAADFRAIETARGNIVFSNLPTSSAGLPSGALWNDAGTVKIV